MAVEACVMLIVLYSASSDLLHGRHRLGVVCDGSACCCVVVCVAVCCGCFSCCWLCGVVVVLMLLL